MNKAGIMSVTTDDSLKLCRHFPAFLWFLWQSICRVVRKLKSFHRVTLPSQLSGRYCMKKKRQTFIFFIWLITQNSVRFTYATTLFQVWEFVKIGFRVLAFLTYRDRVPFCPGFVSLICLLWMFHDKKLTPLYLHSWTKVQMRLTREMSWNRVWLWSVFSRLSAKVQSSNHLIRNFFRFIEFSIVSNLSLPYITQGDHFILPRSPARSRLPSSVFFWRDFLFPCRSVLHTGVN